MRSHFFADLNPAYGARGEKRYALFSRWSDGRTEPCARQYTSKRAAETAAARCNSRATIALAGAAPIPNAGLACWQA
jgi:hypothetical protein